MNEDSRRCTVRFCVITLEACSSPNGPGQRRAIGRRQNINREGCVSDANDFASVRLTTPQIPFLATEYGVCRCQNETINEYLFIIYKYILYKNFSNRQFNPTRFLAAFRLRNVIRKVLIFFQSKDELNHCIMS